MPEQGKAEKCQNCGHEVPPRGRFCPACGHPCVRVKPIAASSSRPDPFEGIRLDNKYRIIKKIDEGGMAKIYKAEHLFLGEICAIKVIKRPDHRRETQYGRFLREARLARRVGALSPNIIRIYDFGYDQKHGVYYYSMELLKGKNLRQVLRTPPYYMSPEQVVHMGLQICTSMQIGHQEEMVHRDLKPDNIFLIKQGGSDNFYVKILDFGLAKSLSVDEPNFTDVGKVVGTPEYMSPEQCRGPTPEERARGISHVDGRSDIYSLGVVFYQALVGRAPFLLEGDPTPQNFLKLMNRQISEKPKPLRQVRKNLPKGLCDVIEKCLKKNPKRRYQSMEEFRHALANALPSALSTAPTIDNAAFQQNAAFQVMELNKLIPAQSTPAPPGVGKLPFKLQIDPELEL